MTTEFVADLRIAAVKLSDIPQVLQLIRQFDRPSSPDPTVEEYTAILRAIECSGGAVLGAYESGAQLVGTCTLNLCSNLSWSGRPYGIIENVIVDRKFRGQGVGKALLHHAVEQANAQGCYKVALMTGSQRESTLAFYRAAGFSADKTGFQIRF